MKTIAKTKERVEKEVVLEVRCDLCGKKRPGSAAAEMGQIEFWFSEHPEMWSRKIDVCISCAEKQFEEFEIKRKYTDSAQKTPRVKKAHLRGKGVPA